MKKKRTLFICLLAMLITFTGSTTVTAGKKAEMRVAYVLKNIGVKSDIQAKLKPLLVSYLAEKKAANKEYDSMKERLSPSINNGTLTEKQAQALLTAKWTAAEKELKVKRDYETKFKTVLSAKKTYLCFDLLNDKKSKIEGKKSSKDDQDD